MIIFCEDGRRGLLCVLLVALTNPLLCLLFALPPGVQTTTGADLTCLDRLRWNCPCKGSVQLAQGDAAVTKRRHHNFAADAIRARDQTREILQRLKSERLREAHHLRLLEDCVDQRGHCTDAHLRQNCTMRGLPGLPVVVALGDRIVTDIEGFLVASRTLMASLAVYVEQARADEQTFVREESRSLEQKILELQESSLYQILCKLRLYFHDQGIDWSPLIPLTLMEGECRAFNELAPIDNRNYMVFYTLEKLFHSIATQFQRVQRNTDFPIPGIRQLREGAMRRSRAVPDAKALRANTEQEEEKNKEVLGSNELFKKPRRHRASKWAERRVQNVFPGERQPMGDELPLNSYGRIDAPAYGQWLLERILKGKSWNDENKYEKKSTGQPQSNTEPSTNQEQPMAIAQEGVEDKTMEEFGPTLDVSNWLRTERQTFPRRADKHAAIDLSGTKPEAIAEQQREGQAVALPVWLKKEVARYLTWKLGRTPGRSRSVTIYLD